MYKGFTDTELELVETLMEQFKAEREDAERHIIDYKKQLVRYYSQEGQKELAIMLMDQVNQYEKDKLLLYIPNK